MKIAVFIESENVRGYVYNILKDLKTCEGCLLSVFILDADEPFKENPLINSFLIFDEKVNAHGVNNFSKKSVKGLELAFYSEKKGEFDIVLNLTDKTIPSEIKAIHGSLELRYGNKQTNDNLAGVLEVFENSYTSKVALVDIKNQKVIDSYVCATHVLSPVRNRSDLLGRSAEMVVRNIEKFEPSKEGLSVVKDRYMDTPSFVETVLPVLGLGLKNITSRIDKLFRKQQWSIYFALNDEGKNFNTNMSAFKEIPTPKEFFWADPFVVDKDDKSYIFFEEYVYKTHKGHLSVIEYDHESGNFSDTKEILNTPYHLSYPFMMEHEGEFYMIPEGSADKDVKLYKATNFPHEWVVVKTLLDDVVAVDTTLFYKDDMWWMFTNIAKESGPALNEELYLFSCKNFLTDVWIPHKSNPVVASLQTSRPAGHIIEHNGEFYRPSQNSVGWYGRSTNFNKIVELTQDNYKEEFVSEITPDFIDGIYAVHTYNASKRMTIIDGLKKIGRFV